jgi:hypothetical protein
VISNNFDSFFKRSYNGVSRYTKAQRNEVISYENLRRHIEASHPMKSTISEDGKPELHRFRMCDPLGGLPLAKSSAGETTEMAKQIGIGPTLFLMSTKVLAMFFIFLTILNFPVYMFYSLGNPAYNKAHLIDSFFATLSLGNVGQKNDMCASENMATPLSAYSKLEDFNY